MPSITSISPDKFDSGKSVTLSGSGFGTAQGSVSIAGQAQTVTSWSDTSITFTTVRGSQSQGSCRVDVVKGSVAGAVTAALSASGWGQEVSAGGTITGPAPLAVFFDATATTSATYEPFREAGYHFDFGYATPTTPGTWAYSGKPKGNQIGGPVAAHVYETPGTYTASVRAQLPNGTYQDKFVTVVVQDPNTVYAGAATVCVSLAGNFSGAPSGATTTTTVPATAASNTRYLFRAGETYSASSFAIAHGTSGIMIDSFGTGARPVIKQIFPTRPFTNSSSQLTKVVVTNCSLDQVVIGFGDYILCHKCDNWGNTTSDGGFTSNVTTEYFAANPPSNTAAQNSRWSRNLVLSECTIASNSAGSYSAYSMGTFHTFIGTDFTVNGVASTHCLRFPFLYKAFIAHNRLRAPIFDRHYIKIHSRGTQEFSYDLTISPSPLSRFVVVTDNQCISANVEQWFALGPQNAQSSELLQDIIVERNSFPSLGTTTPQTAVVITGNRMTVRDSTVSNWPSASYYGIDSHTGGVGGLTTSQVSPYYLPVGEPAIDGVRAFSTPTGLLPSKAGT